VGGPFTNIGGVKRSGIARVNEDGSLDSNFNQGSGAIGVFNVVLDLKLAPDGKAVIIGDFFTVNDTYRPAVARLNTDGSLDLSFDPGAGPVGLNGTRALGLAVQPDGKTIISGDFETVDSIERPGLRGLIETVR